MCNTTSNNNSDTVKKHLSLKERGRLPPSFYVSVALTLSLQYFSGVFTSSSVSIIQSTLSTYANKFRNEHSSHDCDWNYFNFDILSWFHAFVGKRDEEGVVVDIRHVMSTSLALVLIANILYILVWSPLRAGMWTGERSNRHKLHRYAGLSFLCLYGLAWVEFFSNYNDLDKADTLLPHLVALNGLIQAHSAYFSFKVLPYTIDAGYYSDKAVLSRMFVQENGFFQLMGLFGSIYYYDSLRASLQSTMGGKIVEAFFVFWPYVLIRQWFPVTRFSNAGTGRAGRSKKNEQFYSIGTTMIKIFYLWAKYFLGFYVNFLCLLNKINPNDMKFVQGLFLLNLGTVSIGVFLHTLRFKKVLPPRVTFTFYLVQIYLTFFAIPFFGRLFLTHKKLSMLVLLGMICNMTRRLDVHILWCGMMAFLLQFTEIDW